VTGVAGSCGFVEGDGKFFAIARLAVHGLR
jgi:hypothetical protein